MEYFELLKDELIEFGNLEVGLVLYPCSSAVYKKWTLSALALNTQGKGNESGDYISSKNSLTVVIL